MRGDAKSHSTESFQKLSPAPVAIDLGRLHLLLQDLDLIPRRLKFFSELKDCSETLACHDLKLRKIIHKDRLDIHPTTDSFHGRRVVLMRRRASFSDCSDTRQSSGRVPRLEMWKQRIRNFAWLGSHPSICEADRPGESGRNKSCLEIPPWKQSSLPSRQWQFLDLSRH